MINNSTRAMINRKWKDSIPGAILSEVNVLKEMIEVRAGKKICDFFVDIYVFAFLMTMSDKISGFPRINEPNLTMILQNAEEDDIERVIKEVWSDMVDESVLGLCFDVHRSVKLGTFFLDEMKEEEIANSGGNKESDNEDNDNDNDNDWNYNPDRKGDSSSVGSNSSTDSTSLYTNYETMSKSEKKALLVQMCGVISEHTKKMCTKSQRCPQHTDEQRKNVRAFLLKEQNLSEGISEDVHIDIDTYDDEEHQTLKNSLNRQWECNSNEESNVGDSISSINDSWNITAKKKEKFKKQSNTSTKSKKVKKSHLTSSQNSTGSLTSSPI
ncbi:Ataxin-7-like protein 3 [Nymphon striatum]|nr:Ataxin-7-like protein 3 [Nymphon striatum]